ncbi:MAG: hypothetical protein Kow00121_17690 [Elainellaceae cyanobacterium]
MLVSSQIAWAESIYEIQIAQQVVDGLPPPPPVDFGQQALPTSGQAPAAQAPTIPAASPYMVIVNGDSPLLLSQVQAIAANASIQEYNGQRFIYVGSFNDPMMAQQQVATLSSQGIGAEVVTMSVSEAVSATSAVQQQVTVPGELPPPDLLPVAPVPREVEFGQPATTEQPTSSAPPEAVETAAAPVGASSYYIVIPGSEENLEAILNQVIRLGDGFGIAQMVETGDSPGGPHVRVGPFIDRGAANRWNRYFRDFGMGSRIYYKR